MSLTVLSVAYPLAPVRADTAGGAEQVLARLDRELVRRGHRSIVVACDGSRVAGELLPVQLPQTVLDEGAQRTAREATARAVRNALAKFDIDLIHMHGVDFHTYLPPPGVPVLATLHLPPEWYPQAIFNGLRPGTHLHCVSQSQHRRCAATQTLLPPIDNGIDLEEYTPGAGNGGYALILGRICPEKGFHIALHAAERAGMPLVLAGAVFPYPEHERYFREQIAPKLDGVRARWLGNAGPELKRELLAGARCVLIPSLAPETSSLVAMEALASGTPVIAYPSGALADLVREEETGFLVEDAGEMAAAIARAHTIDRQRCRAYAEAHFSFAATADKYMEVYERLAARRTVVRSGKALHDLRSEWTGLFERCPEAPPFLHPAWQLAWWDLFGTCELHAIEVHRNGRLAAFAPLFVYQDRLVFVANGISDQLGVLAEDDEAARELIARMERSGFGLDLQEIPESSPLLALPHEPCSVSPVAAVGGALSPKLRKNVRLQRGYLEREGAVAIDDVGAANAAEAIGLLFELHGARWRERGEDGVIDDNRLQHFHRRVAAEFAREGMLRCYVLRVGGRPIGVWYGFARGTRVYYYLGGFDPEWGKFSPGSLLIDYAFERARASGAKTVDFLRGAEPYKYRWSAVDRSLYRIWR